jgi:hypothetical protein
MTSLRTFESQVAVAIYDAVDASPQPGLDELARNLWRAYGEGLVSEQDASFISLYIARRRPTPNHKRIARSIGRAAQSLVRETSRFVPRQRPRSKKRKASRDRRRRLGGSSALPAELRSSYTEGQRAVLCVVAGEIKHHGICDLPIDKLAALAGVCRTTVQTTLHEARRLRHIDIIERPQRRRKHLTNILKVRAAEWNAWIKRAPSAHSPSGSNSVNLESTTKNKYIDDLSNHTASACSGRQSGLPTSEAIEFAVELQHLAGHREGAPTSWGAACPSQVVQDWLDALASCGSTSPSQSIGLIRQIVLAVMLRKSDPKPPNSPRYFSPEILKLVKQALRPIPAIPPSNGRSRRAPKAARTARVSPKHVSAAGARSELDVQVRAP